MSRYFVFIASDHPHPLFNAIWVFMPIIYLTTQKCINLLVFFQLLLSSCHSTPATSSITTSLVDHLHLIREWFACLGRPNSLVGVKIKETTQQQQVSYPGLVFDTGRCRCPYLDAKFTNRPFWALLLLPVMLPSIKGAERANKTFLHCVGILAANSGRPGAKHEGGS